MNTDPALPLHELKRNWRRYWIDRSTVGEYFAVIVACWHATRLATLLRAKHRAAAS
jgi:hypothetical protein